MTDAKTQEEPEAPVLSVPFEEQQVPRETGELKADATCPNHPDQKLQAEDTPYGSFTTERCPKCAAAEHRADRKAEKAAAEGDDPGRQHGS